MLIINKRGLMGTVRKKYGKSVLFLLMLTVLSACGGEEPETAANQPVAVTSTSDSDGVNEGAAGKPADGAEDVRVTEQPTEGPADEPPAQLTEEPEEEQPAQPAEMPGQEGNRVIRNLTSEEWEQIEQDEALLMFHSGGGGKYYVNIAEETIYCREIYAHESAEGAEHPYFRPVYSSASDETMFALNGTDEGGEQLYDVYYGKELLISGLTMMNGAGEYPLDVCYDVETQEVLLLTYRKDSERKEEGFMIYHASQNDTCVQPLRFYPVLTGEDYQEFIYYDWIGSAILTTEAIYYDILPVQRIDLETGTVAEWGLTKEEYAEATGIDNPMRYQDIKAAGDGYIMTIVSNPDPAFDDMPENTVDTYVIYTEDGELVSAIPNVY